jgi:hypothetical protein
MPANMAAAEEKREKFSYRLAALKPKKTGERRLAG